MKRIATVLIVIILSGSMSAMAQYREHVVSPYEYGGQVLNPDPSRGANLSNLFNMQVSHSYSANFASFGGQFQNLNAFTSSFQMFFNEKLDGRVDVSFLHSPFGGANAFGSNNPMGGRIMIQNAELNYRPNERTLIQVSFRQGPAAMGPFGFGGFNPYGRMNRFGYWY
jgi:hypothetical protein